jgi:putative peptidoglycan lipid II flippase
MLTILYDLLISGMVAAALVPVLTEYVAPERRGELRKIVGSLLTLAVLVLGGVTILLIVFAPQLVTLWLESGSGTIDDALIPEAIRNVRLILPAVMLLGLSAILMATNYSLGRFAWPSVAQAARNLAIIVAMVLLVQVLGVTSMVVGVLAGGVLLVALQLPGLRDALPMPGLALRHPAIRRIFQLYAPIFIGLFANTCGQLIDRNLAAGQAGEDALGAMRYATTLQQLVLGLVATGISLGALPALSRQAESGDEHAFRATLTAALRLTTVLIAPASLGLLVLAGPIVNLLFRHGATNAVGAAAIALALIWYIPGTFFQAYDQLLINVFYARRNTLTPQLVGVAAVVLYIAVELVLVGRFGMVALVGAISVQWTFHAVIMYWLARHMLSAADHRSFARALTICLGVGAIMAAAAWGSATILARTLPGPTLVREILTLAIPVALGAALYAWGITRLGIDDFAVLARRVIGRVRRR